MSFFWNELLVWLTHSKENSKRPTETSIKASPENVNTNISKDGEGEGRE
jgi:hypothetical protein